MSKVIEHVTENVLEECPVCGQRHCPCTLCHGDPDYYLGNTAGQGLSPEEDNIFCGNCGAKIG